MDQNFFQKLVTDRTFRTEFMASPSQFLASAGFADFQGKSVIVHENNATTMHFSLLPKGSDDVIENMDPKFVKIQEKAWEDENFKANLLNNTRAAVMEVFGSIPESLTIKIHENTKDTVHLVLPALAAETDELNDDDLEMIAGGKGGIKSVVNAVHHVAHDVAHTVTDVTHTVVDVMTDPAKQVMGAVNQKTYGLAKDLLHAGQNFFSGW